MKEFFYDSVDGVHKIHAVEWDPEGEPKGIVQIIHGMTEFAARYDEFASFMADHGFCVVGNDHLGHGDSVNSPDDYGFFREKNGNKCLLEDIRTLRDMTRKQFPDVPYFILFRNRQPACCDAEYRDGAVQDDRCRTRMEIQEQTGAEYSVRELQQEIRKRHTCRVAVQKL